ncbi:MAG: hypothetical protein KC496_17900 [Anaerolineae bacterium]|nr:hypothetical protein [Anaerolineae bacterium]
MKKEWFSFTFFGVPVLVRRSALVGSAILLILLTAAAVAFTALTPLDALIAGILATLLHWLGDLVHQYGHAMMAKRVGHPMRGLILAWVLVFSHYPRNEPEIAPELHMQRAIGGPIASAIVAAVAGLLALWMVPMGGMAAFLAWFFLLENLVVFAIGGLFPPVYLPFFCNDGGSILHWWQIRRKQKTPR